MLRHASARFGALTGLAVLASCGGDAARPDDPASVVSVTVSPGEAVLVPLQATQLQATPRDAAGGALTGRTVTWTTSAGSVVTVGSTGTITAVSTGNAVITATSEGRNGSADVTVQDGGWVGPAGARVTAAGGVVTLDVPAGALAAGTALTVAPIAAPPDGAALVPGSAYALGPASSTFAQPVRVTVAYASAQVGAGAVEERLRVHRWSGSVWEPLEAGAADVAGRAASGDAARLGSFALLELPSHPLPRLDALDPSEAEAGGPGLTLRALGADFVPGAQVTWNGNARPTELVSPGELRADIPASDLATPGSAQVGVFNPEPGGGASASRPFTIVAPPAAGVTVSVGSDHACAADDSGRVSCWGAGAYGQLGHGMAARSPVPVAVAGGVAMPVVAAGAAHTCGLTAGGEAWCWGSGREGELGTGSTANRSTPTAVVGGLVFTRIAAGGDGSGGHTCALTAEGAAYCWGYGANGRLGNGSSTSSSVPVAVSGGRVFTAIAVGGRHACGLTGQGAAYCWGANVSGQLGNGTTTQSAVPVAVSGNHVFTRLVAGDAQTCGLTASGEALCWGSRAAYLMLFGTVPAPLGGGLAFADIAVGQDFGCGITTAGATYCWGRGDQGQLGTGLPHTTGDPVPVAGGSSFRSLSARNGTTCGVTTTNTVACWGRRGHGVLGDGHLGWEARPVPVSGGLTFASLDAGDGRTCGITHGGETWCWGHVAGTDFNSQLHEAVPAPVAGPSFASVSVGEGQGPLGSYACGLTAEGAAHCWGANVSGALGTGGTSSSLTPVPVVGGRSFLALGAGREACALTTDGALWCWGGYDGFDPSKLAPTAVPGGSGPFTALAAGAGHVCALLDGGGARCRGFNYSGELGDGTTTTREQPVPVTGGRAYTRISAYADGTCAIEVGGAAWCWGWGVPTPAPVPGGLRFTEISVGGFNAFDPAFACGIADGGGAWCWGENLHGMLGNGLETSSAAPVAVDGPTFVHVTAGVQHACGLTAAGEAWCWGRTDDGQLGHGRTQYSALPVPVSR